MTRCTCSQCRTHDAQIAVSQAEYQELLTRTRSAFVPDRLFAKPERNHHQSSPGRVTLTIRGTT